MKYNRMIRQIENETAKRIRQAREYAQTKPEAERAAYFKKSERLHRKYEREQKATLAELEALEDVGVNAIEIHTEWTKSRNWGMNPHTNAKVYGKGYARNFWGTASGCNYDKHSSAVGKALNSCPYLVKALCDKKEKSIKRVRDFNSDADNRRIFGYGAGYAVIPAFETGGVGMPSLLAVLSSLGFVVVAEFHTNNMDYYKLTKGGRV